jgi:hypothetical protein
MIGGDHPVWGTLDDLTGTETTVLLYYLARANRQGYAWPLVATIVADTGCPRRSVLRAVGTLVKTGRLVSDGKGPGPVNHAPNRYRVVVVP